MAEPTEHAEHSGHAENPLDPKVLFSHVEDSTGLHVPRGLTSDGSGHIEIPQPFAPNKPIVTVHTSSALVNRTIQPLDLKLTKFMVIELVAAILICVFFIGLAKAIRGGALPRGRFRNMLEAMLLYFRDSVARPCIGGHDADRFVPFLWTIFFFVLACNLFGMIPWMGSPTGSLAVTGTLAFITFAVVIGSGVAEAWRGGHLEVAGAAHGPAASDQDLLGSIHFLHRTLWPAGQARRAGRAFVGEHDGGARRAGRHHGVHRCQRISRCSWYGVMPTSVFGATALSMLELFVAFLQAYIFTFLSALFIGMAVHPH